MKLLYNFKDGIIIAAVVLVSLCSCGKKYPYQDPELSFEEMANDLLYHLTL